MANLLVTGGAGFIGANFVHFWRAHHAADRIIVLDALTYSGNRASLRGAEDILFVSGDVCDTKLVEELLSSHAIDTIVHFAAESHVDRSISGPDVFVTTNVLGTHSLLKAAREIWLQPGSEVPHRFHHVSTDEVYGSLGPNDPPFSEATSYAPNSPYSASKAGSDHLVRAYNHTFGLQTTISNCSNNYGPFQFPEKLIPLFIINALHGRALPIYGDGRNIRDWLHVEDHCRGIETILNKGEPGETYNIGGRQELPNLEVVTAICRTIDEGFASDATLRERFPQAPPAKGQPTEVLKNFVEDRSGHDWRYAIDETKIRQNLGFKPQRDFQEGLGDTLEWYLANEDWWTPLVRRAS